jgi:hypothetical protein
LLEFSYFSTWQNIRIKQRTSTTLVDIQNSNGFTIGINPFQILSFYGNTPTAQRTVTGSRGGNAALQSLLIALNQLGLILDNSTA